MKSATPLLQLLVLSLFPTFLFSQIPSMNLKLQLMPDGETWGVYVKPDDNIEIHINQTITIGGSQITVVMPENYPITGLENVNGFWATDAIVNGPSENPTKSYVSFGLQYESLPIPYAAGQETLLFKFKFNNGNCPSNFYLFDSDTDPFNVLPNSVNSNPSNEFAVFDMVNFNNYSYKGNYSPFAWDCHDTDGDGILNAIEDTNGNGVYDPGVDASDLNQPDFAQAEQMAKLKLQLMPDGETYGVYVKPDDNYSPSQNTITGTAQITIVMPKDYEWTEMTSVKGVWSSNSTINAPIQNPTKKYVSFGLNADFPHINYSAGQETLLFTFKKSGNCPDSLYLVDCATDPLCNGASNFNPGNEFSIFDPSNNMLMGYGGNYALSAWSCQDNDGDGILNALEDTNGNGQFDPGVDASDLNEGTATLPVGCIKFKLQLMPDDAGWGVFAKPFDGYLPSVNAVATSGRVTIVAPASLPFGGLENIAGQWSLSSTVYETSGSQSLKYMTFDLQNASSFGLNPTDATLLFTFEKLGDCPEFLYIMENPIPAGIQANELEGTDPSSFTSSSFEYCGVYARKNWRCKTLVGGNGPVIIVTADSLGAPQTETQNREADITESETTNWFTASPNPAGDLVNIQVAEKLVNNHTALTLWDMQGRERQSVLVENTTMKLDLSNLPTGVYLISLAQNGQVVERKKLIKQ
ncbi:MAG: T9SS type A sorting domain-containing protein [Bacteroidetes bacterium]|nr:T9SS type A sorting domain-containing protein [Bacteroidota bacterium]